MEILEMLKEAIIWLQSHLPFLNTKWFPVIYGIIVALNPFAMVPQLISSFRAKPEELKGVSVSMFLIFFTIQSAVALGAVKATDIALFGSMAISAIITLLVMIVTSKRRK